ncbi:ribosome small subunit-dependent GTPase A [Acutalibacter sp.]|uniref:ribosome small subunit-dependent GTPase A n=1 Tax=Acutalibacter sp. TaxID=1918636 RepID=UPI0021728339|nr:ribosome small subunit-dependent GTPase A [Acutalibacter sp.]
MTNLLDYGFPEAFLPRQASAEAASLVPSRVTAVFKERYQLITPHGQRYGRLKTKEYHYEGGQDFPTTGDYVLAQPAGDPDLESAGDWRILRTLPRKSFFSRLDGWHGVEQAVAANMDVVFAVQSLNENFNVKRLERYLTLAWNSGAQPVVVLTKADLPGDHQAMVEAAYEVAGEAPVLALSAKTGQGMEQLDAYLKPRVTAAFLGSSGVGKSSLINALAGQEVMDTGGIREDDARGRHTTTHRQLLRLPSGVLVIDTPGMRELGMWDAAEGLSAAFPDVERFLGQCRFHDCRHGQEPGCAIRGALERGELSPQRWKNYRQLAGESSASQRMKRGQRSKALAKQQRQASKYKKKFTDFT